MYFLGRGKVTLAVSSFDGKEAIVATLDSGEFFGEGCLAGQPLRTATAISVEDCTLTRVEKSVVARMLHEKTGLAEIFVTQLLSRNIRLRVARLQPDDEFSSVLAGIKHRDGCRCYLNTVQDVLPILEASFSNPASERSHSLLVPRRKIGRKKALHDRPLDKQMSLRARPIVPWIPASVGRRTTDRYSRA